VDLTEFLTARLDEEEPAEVCGCLDANHWPPCVPQPWKERERREIAAKRARLAMATRASAELDRLQSDATSSDAERAVAVACAAVAIAAVNHDAAVYSDHPDYRDEWKP
jgi:hypothetical protein